MHFWRDRFWCRRRSINLAFIPLLLLLLAGCEQQIADSNYKRGYSEGYELGKTNGTKQGTDDGRKAGYAEGFAAGEKEGYSKYYNEGHPGTKHEYSRTVKLTHYVFATFGALKIIFAIILFCFMLFERSTSSAELAAKFLFLISGSAVSFFTLPLLGVQGAVDRFLSEPAPINPLTSWIMFILAAVITYVLAKMIEILFGYLSGVWLEVWSIFIAAGFGTFIIHALVKFFYYSPDINDYTGSNILVGVFIGGMMFLAVKLVEQAIHNRETGQTT